MYAIRSYYVKNWLRKEYKEENIVKGRDMLEKEARRRGYDLKTLFKPEWLKDIYKKFTLQTPEDIYSAVGYGGITTGQILHKLVEEYRKENKPVFEKPVTQARTARAGELSGIIVKGYDDMLVRFAKCCNPVPGDSIA